MKTAKIVAIIGALIIIVSFFLPWATLSTYGEEVKVSAYGMASGSPNGNYKDISGIAGMGAASDMVYLNETWNDLLGNVMSSAEIEGIAKINDSFNRLLAEPVYYIFPAAALIIILFSLFGPRTPHVSYGLMLIIISIILAVTLGVKAKNLSMWMNLGNIGGSFFSMFGLQEYVLTTKFGAGIYSTGVGIFVILIAGIIGWQSHSKTTQAHSYSQANYAPNDSYNSQNQSGYHQQRISNQQNHTSAQTNYSTNYSYNSQNQPIYHQQRASNHQNHTSWESQRQQGVNTQQSPDQQWTQPGYQDQQWQNRQNQDLNARNNGYPQGGQHAQPPSRGYPQIRPQDSKEENDNPVSGWRKLK